MGADVTSHLAVVADDDPGVCQLLADILELDGWTTVRATDGLEALELVRSHHPHLVLLDIMMPRCDGIAALRELRADRGFDDVGVVMCSAKSGSMDIRLAMAAGADGYVTKPFTEESLVAAARRALRRAGHTTAPTVLGANGDGDGPEPTRAPRPPGAPRRATRRLFASSGDGGETR